MDTREIIITTSLTVVGILSYRHYDFYKSIFKYLAISVIAFTLIHWLWYMSLSRLFKAIKYDIKPTHISEIEKTFERYSGDIWNTLLVYFISLSVLGILYISPKIIKSHPYNKVNENSTNN